MLFTSDIHFSEKAPVSRSAEEDWYAAMLRPWAALPGWARGLPLVVAGDVFDHWKPSPRLINFAMDIFRMFPLVYAIPGQHDLPQHRYEVRHEAGYGVLCNAGAVVDLTGPLWVDSAGVMLWPFPWGRMPVPPVGRDGSRLDIAVCHRYVWRGRHGYPGAPDEYRLGAYRRALAGYSYAIFGDNHCGFYVPSQGPPVPSVLNCGAFYLRSIADRGFQPAFGVLCSDGSMAFLPMDIAHDRWVARDEGVEITSAGDFDKLVTSLAQLATDGLDFAQAVRRMAEEPGMRPAVRDVILEVLDGAVNDRANA